MTRKEAGGNNGQNIAGGVDASLTPRHKINL